MTESGERPNGNDALHRAATRARATDPSVVVADPFVVDGASAAQDDALDCIELVELVTDYLEGALDVMARRRLERHIAECSGCATYLDQMRQTIRAVGGLRSTDLPPESVAPLLAVLRSYRGS